MIILKKEEQVLIVQMNQLMMIIIIKNVELKNKYLNSINILYFYKFAILA